MKNHLIGTLLAALSFSALAAPPPGHPPTSLSADMLAPSKPVKASSLPNEGTVISTVDASEYTYIEVSNGKQSRWLAAPLSKLKPGNKIRYEDGSTMSNFYSKLLQRNFTSIMFIGQLAVVADK